MIYVVIFMFLTAAVLNVFPQYAVSTTSLDSFYGIFEAGYNLFLGPFKVIASVRNGFVGDGAFFPELNTWLINTFNFDFPSIVTGFFEAIFGPAVDLGNTFLGAIKKAINSISNFATDVSSAVSNAFSVISTKLGEMFEPIKEVLDKIFGWLSKE